MLNSCEEEILKYKIIFSEIILNFFKLMNKTHRLALSTFGFPNVTSGADLKRKSSWLGKAYQIANKIIFNKAENRTSQSNHLISKSFVCS